MNPEIAGIPAMIYEFMRKNRREKAKKTRVTGNLIIVDVKKYKEKSA